MFSKLMSVLTELRSLGYNNSRQCIELRMERNKKLPEFLEEIWDLKWLMALPPPQFQATAGVTDDEDTSSNHSAGDPNFWEKGPHHSPAPIEHNPLKKSPSMIQSALGLFMPRTFPLINSKINSNLEEVVQYLSLINHGSIFHKLNILRKNINPLRNELKARAGIIKNKQWAFVIRLINWGFENTPNRGPFTKSQA